MNLVPSLKGLGFMERCLPSASALGYDCAALRAGWKKGGAITNSPRERPRLAEFLIERRHQHFSRDRSGSDQAVLFARAAAAAARRISPKDIPFPFLLASAPLSDRTLEFIMVSSPPAGTPATLALLRSAPGRDWGSRRRATSPAPALPDRGWSCRRRLPLVCR